MQCRVGWGASAALLRTDIVAESAAVMRLQLHFDAIVHVEPRWMMIQLHACHTTDRRTHSQRADNKLCAVERKSAVAVSRELTFSASSALRDMKPKAVLKSVKVNVRLMESLLSL